MDRGTRSRVRFAIDETRRRELGAELDEQGETNLRVSGGRAGFPGLAVFAWEAAGGDPLEALSLALERARSSRCGGSLRERPAAP